MRLQARLYECTRKNCETYKEKWFSKEDVITRGYLVGHAVDRFEVKQLNKEEVETYQLNLTDSDMEGVLTSLTIREDTNRRLGEIKAHLDELFEYKKSFSINEVIDIILAFSLTTNEAMSDEVMSNEDEWIENELVFVQKAYRLLRLSHSDSTKRSYIVRAQNIIEKGLSD